MKVKIGLIIAALLVGSSLQAADGFYVLRVSTPLIASAAAGLRFGGDKESLRPTIQAEAGFGGGKVAVGLDNTGEKATGFGLKAAYLHTWLEPVEVDDDQDFIGLEGEMSIRRFIINLGGYARVAEGDDDFLLAAGLGFVF